MQKTLCAAVAALACLAAISTPAVAATTRFTISGNEVTDNATLLVWQRCSEGQILSNGICTGAASVFTWQEALAHAQAVSAETGVAWRLPNIKELGSIVKVARIGPAIDTATFVDTPSAIYWSSTPQAGNPNGFWAINFNYGGMAPMGVRYLYAVRLVRAGRP